MIKSFKSYLFEKEYSEAPVKVTPDSVPSKLYHATDNKAKLDSILKNGLRPSRASNTWGYAGQKEGVIYLASRPLGRDDNIKKFYANIEIDTSHPSFDKNKLYLDENRYTEASGWGPEKDITLILQNFGNIYFEYDAREGIISPEAISYHSQVEENAS